MPLGLTLFLLAGLEAVGSCLPILLGLLKVMSLSGAGTTSFLLGGFHQHDSSVTPGFSVFPILTQSSTLNKIAAAWLQHEPSLKCENDVIKHIDLSHITRLNLITPRAGTE